MSYDTIVLDARSKFHSKNREQFYDVLTRIRTITRSELGKEAGGGGGMEKKIKNEGKSVNKIVAKRRKRVDGKIDRKERNEDKSSVTVVW